MKDKHFRKTRVRQAVNDIKSRGHGKQKRINPKIHQPIRRK